MSPLLEPEKLAEIVVPMFANASMREHRLRNGASARVILGVAAQDDCAAVQLRGPQILVFGSDYVRGPKFVLHERGYLSNYDIGWYLAGANISDIAAMGAHPVGLLSVVRYPKDLDDVEFKAILQGIHDCCATVGAENIGGDIGTAERIVLSASAFGFVEPDSLLARADARAGQIVVLTGPTGLAGAAMKLLTSDSGLALDRHEELALLRPWRRVEPRVQHGRMLSRTPGSGACIDTSDGLSGALRQLATASNVALRIERDLVPIAPLVERVAKHLGVDVLDLVFGDSVDFELVATVDEHNLGELMDAAQAQGLNYYPIGVVTEGQDVKLIVNGERQELPGVPWINAT